jgi:UDP-glucose 6-dehydrogenase
MAKVAVIGHGRVGADTARFLRRAHEVAVYDPLQREHERATVVDGCVAAFLCVPTPPLGGGSGRCDTIIVRGTVGWLADYYPQCLAVVRSTVPPGEVTARHVMWPETLASESAYPTPHGFDRDVPADTQQVVDLLLPCGGPHKRYVQATAELACLAKYLVNAFGAMKVAFCYEMEAACRAAGLDWHAARELLLLDPRIGPDWTAVFPGNKEPYSGKCLPKDIAALAAWCGQAGHDAGLLRAVIEANGRLGELRGR